MIIRSSMANCIAPVRMYLLPSQVTPAWTQMSCRQSAKHIKIAYPRSQQLRKRSNNMTSLFTTEGSAIQTVSVQVGSVDASRIQSEKDAVRQQK